MLRGNKAVTCCGPNNAVSLDPFSLGESAPGMQAVHTVIFARICSPFPKIRHQSELSSLNHPPFQNISSNNSSSIAAHSTLFFFLQANTLCESSVFSYVFFLTVLRQSTRGDRFSCRLLSCSDCFSCSKSSGFKKTLPSPL